MDRIDPNADSRGNWTKINHSLDLHDLANRRVTQLRQLASQKRSGRGNVSEGLYPFKIYLAQPYQIPSDKLGGTSDETNGWRTFLVRCGRVEDKVLDGDGCDYYDTDPDSDVYPMGTGDTEDQTKQVTPIIIDAGEDAYWFWIELTYDTNSGTWQPQLRHGNDPTDNDDAVNDWTTFPKNDGLHIPIGFVNTADTPGYAITRQLLRADILPGYKIETCDKDNNPITLHIPGAFKEPNKPTDP